MNWHFYVRFLRTFLRNILCKFCVFKLVSMCSSCITDIYSTLLQSLYQVLSIVFDVQLYTVVIIVLSYTTRFVNLKLHSFLWLFTKNLHVAYR